jgi:hypothetical protein
MKIGELAHKIAVHRVHAWRLARAGIVPGTKRTKGGHFYFVECAALSRWIGKMRSYRFRKNELARAYQTNYGTRTAAQYGAEQEHWVAYRRTKKNRKEFKNYKNTYDDLFNEFYQDTDDLIRILDELIGWHECKLKAEMLKTSRERLIILRDLIDKWLNQQQSNAP